MVNVSGSCQTIGCSELDVEYKFIFIEESEIVAICGACRNNITNLQVND